jgi:hypothetical protein
LYNTFWSKTNKRDIKNLVGWQDNGITVSGSRFRSWWG